MTLGPRVNGHADFDTVLDAAIARVQSGASIEEAVAGYPTFADDLRPLLEMASFTIDLAPAPPNPAARARVRATVRAAAEARLAAKPWWRPVGAQGGLRPFGYALAASAALLLGGGGTLVASAGALPGDPLYSVKLATEDARLAVVQTTGDPEQQVKLQSELAARRLAEAQALVDQGRDIPPGVIESAAAHTAAVERQVAQLPEPQRAQVAAIAATTTARQEHVVEHVLEKASPEALPTIQRALSQGSAAATKKATAVHDEDGRSTSVPATRAVLPTRSATPSGAGTRATVTPAPRTAANPATAEAREERGETARQREQERVQAQETARAAAERAAEETRTARQPNRAEGSQAGRQSGGEQGGRAADEGNQESRRVSATTRPAQEPTARATLRLATPTRVVSTPRPTQAPRRTSERNED